MATSSLELGIDMGAVDLVIQVESPKSVTAGLQRIGRAGHGVGEVSKGRIFPKFRADLLECAVVVKRMRDGEIEATVVPRNPLDVLAQQIVAIVAAGDDWRAGELHELVRRAYPFSELSRELLDSVLDMLDGRYPCEEFAELRPRIVWDRVADTIRARKGARQLAVTNAGTIPDRGLYGVHLPDGRRVGELDEEMVYEARPGQTFLLGACTWRIEEITRDRVIVTPAPGAPGAVPFWKGDGIGRPKELGEAIGAFSREAVDRDPADLAADYDLDERAAKNLSAYLREQRDATRVVPSDRTIVVERFRDEIGDWRLCVLSPFGGRVHAAWALALSARIRDEFGLESDAIWSDDGIIVHLPDADEPPSADLVMVEPDVLEELVVRELSGSALFGARFRENAARALLLPRAYPGKRTPLWQQRLKAQSLLEVAKRYGQFPIVLETYRECLRDVLDLPGPRGAAARAAHARAVAGGGGDPARLPVRLVAAVRLRGHLHVRGRHAERRAARRRARARPRPAARAARPGGAARADRPGGARRGGGRPPAPERAHAGRELRRPARRAARARRPDRGRGAGALPRRGVGRSGCSRELERQRRAVRMRIGGEERWIASEDAGLYRDALGAVPPGGLPDAFLEEVEEPLARLARRYARTHGPFTTRRRWRAATAWTSGRCCASSSGRGSLVQGELRPGGSEREWCDPDVLRRLRRASLASLRKEVEPAEQRALARFLPAWQGVDSAPAGGAGVDRLRELLVPLQGLALAPQVWERDVLPRRAGSYSPAWIDQLCAGGELVWVGAGSLGRSSGRVALYFRDDARWLGPPPVKGDPPAEPLHEAIRERLARGAAFWTDLLADLADAEPLELQEALWDLVWAGEVTNDAFAPLRAPRLSLARRDRDGRPPLRAPPPARARRRCRAAGRSPRRCSPTRPRTGRACARWPRCCSSATGS